MKQICIICGDSTYTGMLAAELKRRGYRTGAARSAFGASLAIVDLDSVADTGLQIPVITFSRSRDADLKRPFSIDALVSKITETITVTDIITEENENEIFVTPDRSGLSVYVGAKAIALSAQEFLLFSVLYENAGNLVSKTDLEKAVWGGEGNDNRLRVYIKYLRDKIEIPYGKRLIYSVRNEGYFMRLS